LYGFKPDRLDAVELLPSRVDYGLLNYDTTLLYLLYHSSAYSTWQKFLFTVSDLDKPNVTWKELVINVFEKSENTVFRCKFRRITRN